MFLAISASVLIKLPGYLTVISSATA